MVAMAGAALAVGCEDVSRFTTKPDESFCGSIVPGAFVRRGFEPGVRMRLQFDAERLQEAPGTLWTDDGLFDQAPLLVLPELQHDPLSLLDFGEGRVRNLLYAAGPTSGPQAFVVISLLENDRVEVRLLRGAPPAPNQTAEAVPDSKPLFGVFPLERQSGTCGF